MSDIDGLIFIALHYFNIQPTDLMLFLSLAFIIVCAFYGMQSGFYQGMGSAFIALTFCTLSTFIPMHVYALMCVILALIISGKFIGLGGK